MANLTLELEGLSSPLDVRNFRIKAAMSQPFAVELVAVSPDPDIAFARHIGLGATFSIALAPFSEVPWVAVDRTLIYKGVCTSLQQLRAEPKGLSTYRLELTPRFGLSELRRSYGVHQRATALDVATSILTRARIPLELAVTPTAYPALETCVQYDETDLGFVSRVLASAGLSFHFSTRGPLLADPPMVISEHPGAAPPWGPPIPFADDVSARPKGGPWVSEVVSGAELRPGALTLRGYDFTRPAFEVIASDQVATGVNEHYQYRPSLGWIVQSAAELVRPVADAAGLIRQDMGALRALAHRGLLGLRGSPEQTSFTTNALELVPGTVCMIAGHPRTELSERPLLVIASETEGSATDEWRHRVTAVFADEEYRPPSTFHTPRATGVETGVVVGPPGEKIHVDEFGRVRVRFHWDRSNSDTCWLRVSQAWAGPGLGFAAHPRVNDEVLIAFIGGDPNQPVVVGRLHNATAPPPFDLPAEKNKTGLRTHSTPQGEGFSELSFDDTETHEKVHLRAERDLNVLVRHDRTTVVDHDDLTTIEHDQSLQVLGKQHVDVQKDRDLVLHADDRQRVVGSRQVHVGGDTTTHVEGSSRTTITLDEEINVEGDVRRTLERDLTTRVVGSASMLVGKYEAPQAATLIVEGTAQAAIADSLDLASDKEIVLRVGESFLRIGKGEVVIGAAKITLHAKDARLLMDDGVAKLKVKSKLQVVSEDAIKLVSSGASVTLTSGAKVAGSFVKLSSSADSASDSVDSSNVETTTIELVDQDGEPIPYQRYRIDLDDGSAFIGYLNHEGRAVVHLEGSGRVSFPDLRKTEED
ncbi:MAG: type VI secretion system tip protein TssI/VgrG [Polyangiaceae bacterium]